MILALATFVNSGNEQAIHSTGLSFTLRIAMGPDSGYILLSYSHNPKAFQDQIPILQGICGNDSCQTGMNILVSLKTQTTHVLSLNSNWKRLLVILAPLCPENTNILSRHTATGKLQQDGGISPL